MSSNGEPAAAKSATAADGAGERDAAGVRPHEEGARQGSRAAFWVVLAAYLAYLAALIVLAVLQKLA